MIQFLNSVLPATGNYVIHIHNNEPNGKSWVKNIHADTLQDLAQQATALDADPKVTVFFALGAFEDNIHVDPGTGRTKVGRTKDKAARFKTLAFDVDPKDRHNNVLYENQRAMARTTMETCAKIGLPDPVFVSSGNGLHCYYPLTIELSRDMWTTISTMLRDALTATGMVLDTTKVCDASMVLRPVGTSNKKATGNKPVRLLSSLTSYDPLVIAQALKAFLKKAPVAKKGPAKRSSVMNAILSSQEYPPVDSTLLEQRCAQIGAIASSGGVVDEPLWHKGIGAAKHCIDPEVTAHRWSDKHPKYSAQETANKLDMWKVGPPTCAAFEALDKGPCSSCAHRGRITSPVQLGVPDVATPVAVTPTKVINPPAGYRFIKDKIFRVIDGEATFVSEYLIYPSTRYKDKATGKSICLTEVKLPKEGWQTFELPMDTLAKSAEFQGWLINHQIFVHTEAGLTALRKYMLTYLQELQQETESDTMASSFGWVDAECKEFVLGPKLIRENDVGHVRLAKSAADFADAVVSKGDKHEWQKATEIFNEPDMQLHGLTFLSLIGSPLMIGSGLKAVLINMRSKGSGTGKTTTGMFAASMYGNPHKLALTVKDTDNSLFKSIGVYGNMPSYIDEITTIERDRLKQIAFFITQGRERRRMTKEGGFQESVEWNSTIGSSSNSCIYELLGEKQSMDGESMRILQFTMPEPAIFNAGGESLGRKMSLFMGENYGLTAEEFIQTIIRLGGPFKIFDQALTEFSKKFAFSFTGPERFWQSAFIIAYATGRICNKLGITNIDVDACIRAGLAAVIELRRELADKVLDCFDTLGLYMGEHASKVVVHRTNTSMRHPGTVQAPYPFEAVARVEVLCTNSSPFTSGRLFLNHVHFGNWCHERGIDRRNVMAQFAAHGIVVHKDRRISLMRGTDKPLPAVRVVEMEMTHPRFVAMMQQDDGGILTPSHLKLVEGAKNA
jgi:hypothetical protein